MIRAVETPHESVWLRVRGWQRPRTRWLALAVFAVAAVTATTIAARWWVGYQPLTSGCCTARAYEGNRSSYGWTLHNDGRFDVRVSDIDAGDNLGIFMDTRVAIAPNTDDFSSAREIPFRPFTLAPGESRLIFLSGVVSCGKARQGIGALLVQQRVHFIVLGLPKARWIPFGEVKAKPPPGTCPGSKL